MTAPLAIGLDAAATKILSGIVDREGTVSAQRRVAALGDSEEDALLARGGVVEELPDERVASVRNEIPADLERPTSWILRPAELRTKSGLAGARLVAFEALDGRR